MTKLHRNLSPTQVLTYIFSIKKISIFRSLNYQICKFLGVIGAIDGTHINLKVPMNQHDSYANRYLSHSINLMAISTARKIFTYVFIGYPGSAHDSRVILNLSYYLSYLFQVFSNSLFSLNIQRHGPQIYFPHERYHLIGDSAFPLRTWLMTPYRKTNNMPRIQKHHNSCLSSNRVCIEHAFGLLKGRWRRLFFINTYSISKAIEIVTVACILHNFCYLCCDEWENENMHVEDDEIEYEEDHRDRDQLLLGTIKRNNIAQNLL
jgi:hypothetical protein